MNTKQKRIILAALLAMLVPALTWLITGAEIFTKTERPVEVVDELFCTTTIEWQSTFVLGLDIALPVVLALSVLGAILVFLFRNKHQVNA